MIAAYLLDKSRPFGGMTNDGVLGMRFSKINNAVQLAGWSISRLIKSDCSGNLRAPIQAARVTIAEEPARDTLGAYAAEWFAHHYWHSSLAR